MVNFFGKRKSGPKARAATAAPAGQSALAQIAKMKETSNNLEKRELFLVTKVDSELKNAVQRKKKGDVKGAKLHLKRKMMYQKQVDVLSNSRMNLETQILTIEAATVAGATVDAMRDGVSVMNRLIKKNDPDKVAETMDEIAEGNQMANELGEVLGMPLDMTDDSELEAELGMLDSLDAGTTNVGDADEAALLEELGDLLPPTRTTSKRRSKRRSRKKSADPFANVPKVPTKKPSPVSMEDEEINRLLVEMG